MRFLRLCSAFAACLAFAGAAPLPDDERAVAAKIDKLIVAKCGGAGVTPAAIAGDAEFLRRASLDLIGTIPTAGETREFLADASPDKRERLIDELLLRPDHSTHLASLWREDLLATVENRDLLPPDSLRLLDHWLRLRFLRNDGYHTLAAGLLTATGAVAADRGAAVYLTAHQAAPERLASGTSRMFLGVQVDCAQCHDHPFTKWSQNDFWSYAAVFAQIRSTPDPDGSMLMRVEDGTAAPVTILDTTQVVDARFLGATDAVGETSSRRAALADWLTAPENPYFARTAVNRLWAVLFGFGLVHPIDDFGDHNAPSHPQVLNLLAQDFSRNGYDVRRLLRILANTQTYQRTSHGDGSGDPRLFARKAVRPLSPRQLHASLRTAAGLLPAPEADVEARQFVQRFDNAVSRVEYQAGIPQALLLMNGDVVASLTDPQQGRLISAAADAPFFSDVERIESLFLATLTRLPTDAESERCQNLLKEDDDTREALSDILWALLNTSEFALNH
ncbi:MAG: DUF1549 and DUF1553 domain-containing protein [Planctomycetota bacterium]|nr:DUF1553 domain-containing protein [Planctomycetaceae bacterium]MDQ3331672.1 DUF1549 and DUF1553 domain-containing protein [Planctomycetota bacterium]